MAFFIKRDNTNKFAFVNTDPSNVNLFEFLFMHDEIFFYLYYAANER
jgi:hypothetical protein